jgi:hypothetical protein
MVAFLSKDNRASTSVETRPGISARISLPNSVSCRGFVKGVQRTFGRAHEAVQAVLDLLVAAAALLLRVLDGDIDQRSISLVFDGC